MKVMGDCKMKGVNIIVKTYVFDLGLQSLRKIVFIPVRLNFTSLSSHKVLLDLQGKSIDQRVY